MNDDHLPPHNLEAEESLLGAILLRPSILADLTPILDPSDFFASEHQHIYEGILRLWDAGKAIDAVTVVDSLDGLTSGQKLMTLQNATPSTSAFGRYADIVIEHSRRRRLIAHAADVINQAYQPSADVDRILSFMDPSADRLIAPRSADIGGLWEIGSFMRMAQETSDNDPWLVPHILKPRWRVIIVAAEGQGKATLLRMIALHAAAGRDPWLPNDEYPKRRVLYVDVENATSSIQHQMRIANTSRDMNLIRDAYDHLHIWHREGGMDLRERRPRAEFEAVLQRTRPEIVFAGPLYKLFRKARGETDEQAALEFSQIIDDLRVRYNFAIVLEHHAPKASGGGYRELNPFGSSLWLRWPEFGITMEPQGNVSPTDMRFTMELGRFRRDREVADWPDSLERGISSAITPWVPRWTKTGRFERVLDAGLEL